MATEQITIRVDTKAAQAYNSASDEERRKLELLVSLQILEFTRPQRSLKEVMNVISRNAQRRGLTPEILQSILDETS